MKRRTAWVVVTGALALLSSGCVANTSGTHSAAGEGASTGGGPLSVTSTDDTCELSAEQAPAGTVTFQVTNSGSQVTEFYLLAGDGQRIVGEVENIGPGLTRNLVVSASEGDYVTVCKPGMTGEGIRSEFVVAGAGAGAADQPDTPSIARATRSYGAYVRDQSDQLLARTGDFVAAYTAGQDDRARQLYPRARVHWERIETVAESFGDLDPKMDAREADLEPGQRWTGWHRIEKDLWPPAAYSPLNPTQRRAFADDLLGNTRILDRRIQKLDFTLDQIANGSRALLEEVATGKVTGEEERWSHTDLWDFQANVDGARVGYEGIRGVLKTKDAELAATLDRRFAELQTLLDRHRRGDGFVSYTTLSTTEVKQLSDAVNALSEPLSRLTAAVLS